ncbi:MAG: preprotein translocase subunit SecE [Cetobacterium sp.]
MRLINDVRREYSKVEWPRKKEIVAATSWVVAMSIFLGIYLGVFDIIASRLLKMLVSLFGG